MTSLVRSLRHRNFRLYFFGQGISVTGTWMQSVAMGWLAYRLTGSAALFGVVGFTGQILTFVIAPFAGVVADRWNRRRLIIVAQATAMAQALALAALTLAGVIEEDAPFALPLLIALSVFTGLVRGFEVPTRQSFMLQMLDEPDDLPNAIAMNSFLVNTARLTGPLVAGYIVAWFNEGLCFIINGVTYAAVIVALPEPAEVELAIRTERGAVHDCGAREACLEAPEVLRIVHRVGARNARRSTLV